MMADTQIITYASMMTDTKLIIIEAEILADTQITTEADMTVDIV